MNKNSILLITGGTGSFGRAMLNKYIDDKNLKEIRILSRDEEKQDFLRRTIQNSKVKFYLGDVRDYNSIKDSVKGSDYIFHAAALKQVPSCEFFPIQAVQTNILGTDNVLNAAVEFSVKKVVVLSTDKAVYPINAMGMTKALMEKVMIAKSRVKNSKTLICGTRYGNIIFSRGSVVPIFINQIKNNLNITITQSNMTRFMMNLNSAVDLVISAFKYGKSGDIFVQKAPATNMLTLSETLKELYKSKSKIEYVGIRHGEKIFETLINREEFEKCIEKSNHYIIPADLRSMDYHHYTKKITKQKFINKEYTSDNTHQLNKKELKKLLLEVNEIRSDIKNL
jgi:UDP-N-acetylglucosamine 4,6-dehydratase